MEIQRVLETTLLDSRLWRAHLGGAGTTTTLCDVPRNPKEGVAKPSARESGKNRFVSSSFV